MKIVLVVIGVVVATLVGIRIFGPGARGDASARNSTPLLGQHSAPLPLPATQNVDAELLDRISALCARAGSAVSVVVTHVESGRTVALQGGAQMPLYSVFKLPLAISVLKDVAENRLELEMKVRITPAEVAPGWQGNTALWRKPLERTVRELLELSIVRSDNTSSDKLLQLVGGPPAVTKRMRSLGFLEINIVSSVRAFASDRQKQNTASSHDLARLLVQLQKGELLQPTHVQLLLGFMSHSRVGVKRLRGDLPAGTPVADKTGTGEAGSVTNDVGLITLPEKKGHLAMVVLMSGSTLPVDAQEKLIAELARVAYDAHVSRVAFGSE